ncbi:MAG TPA: hypothetical protein VEG40_11825 [Gaiellaceae bacterium]|nr:hypothetical protein [Gaiellaceae bacterium]
MTNPPEEPSRPSMMPGIASGATLPIPGNAEFLLYAVIEITLILIWIIAKSVDTQSWSIYTVALTSFYILSRGIAKASRVLEQ